MEHQHLVDRLRAAGKRITVQRRAIVREFVKARTPLTAVQVVASLAGVNLKVNKTTVYRELKFLEDTGILRSLQFEERNRRYELVPAEHRHHLICTACKKIDDVVLDHDLDHIEEKLRGKTDFRIERHALEFYGVCGKCQ